MKILAFLLALLPGVALAQAGPEVYRPATPSQILPYSTSSVEITAAIVHRVIRLVCTTTCYTAISPSGFTFPASSATGIYLPAGAVQMFLVSPGSKVSVVRDASDGSLHVLELSR